MSDNDTQEWINETFGERIEETDGVTLEDVQGWYEDRLEEFGDERLARTSVQADWNELINTGADSKVEIVTIGGDFDPFNNGEVFLGYGLIVPENDPVGLGVVMFDARNGADLDNAMEHFYNFLTPVRGEFNIRSAEQVNGAYRLDAVKGTTLETFEAERDFDERKELVDDFVDAVQIGSISDGLSIVADNGFAADFGVDLRRIEAARVLEARVGEAGRLEVQDDSFIEARDLHDDVRGDSNARGLVCWVDKEIVDFGAGSFVDLYGAITPNRDGQITMNVFGADVIHREELETNGSASSEESASEASAPGPTEERTI